MPMRAPTAIASLMLGAAIAVQSVSAQPDAPAYQQALQRSTAIDPLNDVLVAAEAGTYAFALADFERAAELFDRALLRIAAVYAGNEQAAKARSLWREEGSKEFKGEPYERAMAYYYRGLLDLVAGDYENARAGFGSGLLQDAFAEEEQNRTDFAALMLLDAWASRANGDQGRADEAFAEMLKLRPHLQTPTESQRVLVIVESGKSPRKLADGIGHNLLVYRRGKRFAEHRVALQKADGSTQQLYPVEDIYWQAASRGGRPVDGILEGKAQFRNTTAGVGGVMSDVANQAAIFSPAIGGNASGVFGAITAVGAITILIGNQARAEADTRYWPNLPDALHVGFLTMEEAQAVRGIVAHDAAGRPLADAPPQFWLKADARGNALLWGTTRPVSAR